MNFNKAALLFISLSFSISSVNADGIDRLVDKAVSGSGDNQKELLASEVLISESEVKALSHLEGLIKKYRGTSMEPELKFRLAELYMNRAKSARFIEQIVSEDTAVKSFLPPRIKSLKEKSMVRKAIAQYKEIEQRFPRYPKLDQVLFNNAFAHLQLLNDDEAEKIFIRLLTTQKRSSLRPDAYLATGEINFQKRNFKRALAFYARVKKYPNSKVYPYGLYKGSWCYYNLNGYSQAIADLEKVIAFGAKVEAEGRDQRMDLRNEALTDMALFYSAVRSPKDATVYFVNLSGNKDPIPALRRLTKIYEKHGKDINQTIVLLDLIKRFPESEKRPFFHSDLAESLNRQHKYENAAANLYAFYNTCKKVTLSQKPERPLEEPCDEKVTGQSRRLSLKWLKMYQENRVKNKGMALVAEKALRVHLADKKPIDENSYLRFLFAEHLFELKKFDEASQEYTKVADSTQEKKRKHQSRYAAVVAFDKVHNSKFKGKDEDHFRALSQKYMKDFPKGEKYLDVGFKLALHDYTTKKYDAAGPLLVELGNEFYKEEKGKKSQDLYLDILNSKKDYVQIQEFARKWQKTESDSKRFASLQGIYEQAFFAEVADLEKLNKNKKAIERYKTFIAENPKSDLIDEARWNKINLHFKLKEYNKTAEGYISFHELHPKNKKAIPGLVKAVEIYEMMAEPEHSFKVSEILKKTDLKNKKRWSFLSASYLKASGRYEASAKEFYAIYKSPGKSEFKEPSKEEFLSMNEELMALSPWYAGVIKSLMLSPSRSLASIAVRYQADKLYKNNENVELFKFVSKYKNKKNLDKSKIALLNFYEGKKREQEYLKTVISSKTMDSLVAGIQRKIAKMDRVQAEYQKSLQDEDPKVAISALLNLSQTYQSFVEEIKNIKPPAGFGPEEIEALRAELSNIIMPFEERAVEAVDQAIKVAKEHELKDGSIEKVKIIFDKLNFAEKEVYPLQVNIPEPSGPRGY